MLTQRHVHRSSESVISAQPKALVRWVSSSLDFHHHLTLLLLRAELPAVVRSVKPLTLYSAGKTLSLRLQNDVLSFHDYVCRSNQFAKHLVVSKSLYSQVRPLHAEL